MARSSDGFRFRIGLEGGCQAVSDQNWFPCDSYQTCSLSLLVAFS